MHELDRKSQLTARLKSKVNVLEKVTQESYKFYVFTIINQIKVTHKILIKISKRFNQRTV